MAVEMASRQGAASVGDLRIAYESVGTGSPAVVLIHGIFGDRDYFAPLTQHLAEQRRVVTLDLRGHGRSDVPDAVSVDDFVADVTAVVRGEGLHDVVLCGHSVGGAIALQVAAAHPEWVRAVALLDGAVLFPETLRRQVLEGFVPSLRTEHWREALAGYFERTLDPNDPPEVKARVKADLGRAHQNIARTFFASLMATDFADVFNDVRCPVLYVHAKAPTDLQRLVQLYPEVMVGQVIASGHYLMLSAPDQVNAMLDRYLELVGAPARSALLRDS